VKILSPLSFCTTLKIGKSIAFLKKAIEASAFLKKAWQKTSMKKYVTGFFSVKFSLRRQAHFPRRNFCLVHCARLRQTPDLPYFTGVSGVF
jgi:hypothetical protein